MKITGNGVEWGRSSPAVLTSHSNRSTNAEPPVLAPALERRLLASTDRSLEDGLALLRWWREVNVRDAFRDRFEETLTFNRPESSFGFFDRAPIRDRTLPVMGNFQSLEYDHSKSPVARNRAAEWMQVQLREFVLRYFLRVSDFREPEALVRGATTASANEAARRGFGFCQLYYKRCGSNRVKRFSDDERHSIIDLREMGSLYEYVVLWVQIFGFEIRLAPFGERLPRISIPLFEGNYIIISPEFVIFEDFPEAPQELGRYGVGYALIRNPQPGIFAYGPGEFDAGFESIEFVVYKDGRVRVNMAFVSNLPDRILNLSLDPLTWLFRGWDASRRRFGFGRSRSRDTLRPPSPFSGLSFDPVFGFIRAANYLTAGRAASDFQISERELLKRFLLRHFQQHYHTIAGSLRTWRQIPDWTDTSSLPQWILTGKSA